MADLSSFPAKRGQPRLLAQVRNAIRRRHYSYRTEQAYVHWIKRYIHFHGKRHPGEMAATEVTAFLTHLARDRSVSASTQNQALSPLLLTIDEVRALLARLEGTKWMMASLLYGAGLRLRECLKLRVKDVDFGYRQITVRDGKGGRGVASPLDRIEQARGSYGHA